MNEAILNSNVEYIREYMDNNDYVSNDYKIDKMCDIIFDITDNYDPSVELVDYLCQFDKIRSGLLIKLVEVCNIKKVKHIINNYNTDDSISGTLFKCIYESSLKENFKSLLDLLIDHYNKNITIDILSEIKNCLLGPYYKEFDIITYILFRVIDPQVFSMLSNLSDDDILKMESLLYIVVSCNGPEPLINLLLQYLPPTFCLHNKEYRESLKTQNSEYKNYISMFTEDI
jgi:hypothetical protein